MALVTSGGANPRRLHGVALNCLQSSQHILQAQKVLNVVPIVEVGVHVTVVLLNAMRRQMLIPHSDRGSRFTCVEISLFIVHRV